MEEEILAARLREGSREAFDELYHKYKNMALHTAYLITGNLADRMKSSEATSSLDKIIQTEEAERIMAAVRLLPVKLKTVVVLYYYDSFSVKEIAGMLNIMEGTVKSRLHTARRRIKASLQAGRKRRTSMKHISIKKFCAVAAAACLLVSGISVLAVKVDLFVSVGGMAPDYTDYRDMEKVQAKLGYKMDSVERFANGYEFAGASVDFIAACSEENGEMYHVPSADVRYRKDGKLIDLTVSETAVDTSGIRPAKPKDTRACGDIILRYDEVTNKMIPKGYELTAEDMSNMQRDDFNIVSMTVEEKENDTAEGQAAADKEKRARCYVGANDSTISVTLKQTGESWMHWKEGGEPFTSQTKTVSWEKDGKYYDLTGTDLEISAGELFDMAEEILDAGLN